MRNRGCNEGKHKVRMGIMHLVSWFGPAQKDMPLAVVAPRLAQKKPLSNVRIPQCRY